MHSPATPPLYILVAGEASGDLLGAGLIEALRARVPAARFAGIGGPRMVAAGLEAWHAADKLAVGLARAATCRCRIRGDVRKRTLAARPQAFIGIDAPDFNLPLERRLKQAGIHTIHYVSPSIWAWRERRAAKIGESADRVLCLFPMEPAVYARHGVDARFVGHPLADAFALRPDQDAARKALGLAAGHPVLALLPGSRLGEIRRLGSDFTRGQPAGSASPAEAVADGCSGLPRAPPPRSPAVRCCRSACMSSTARTRVMIAADAVLVVSGTPRSSMLAGRWWSPTDWPTTHRIVTGLGLFVERDRRRTIWPGANSCANSCRMHARRRHWPMRWNRSAGTAHRSRLACRIRARIGCPAATPIATRPKPYSRDHAVDARMTEALPAPSSPDRHAARRRRRRLLRFLAVAAFLALLGLVPLTEKAWLEKAYGLVIVCSTMLFLLFVSARLAFALLLTTLVYGLLAGISMLKFEYC